MTDRETLSKYLRKVTGELRKANARVGQLEQRDREPIAIVGMSCRLPGGVSSPRQLWDLVAAGGDAISGFPEDRGWDLDRLYDPDPDNPGTSHTREGGFLAEAGEFDAEFFGIAPREALVMDPQQRLLLEASWEALEDAGIDPGRLRGSPTGIFAGVMYHDYGIGSAPAVDGHQALDSTGSFVPGRVAYTLGLEGPAVAVDTACSSSLVAMHLAAQALRSEECSLALAGGVTVMAGPASFIEMSRQRGLAPDGRCKPFAAAADGAGFSEGVALVLLERLSDARRNGHRVLATIRGSATNQDGASNGLTAPNGPAQERVIRQALANAGLTPAEIDAVEAHGTGTTLGDPIEAQALLATYGQGRPAGRPLLLGSLKSNIGHAQAAAGAAGVIKTVMAMQEGVLPKTLHLDQPTPHVEWDAGEVELLAEALPWEANGRPRRAGVSSFGASGTNAHLIVEEAPPAAPAEGGEPPAKVAPALNAVPFLLSAKSEEALGAQAGRLRAHLERNPDLDRFDVGFSLATGRAALEHRAAVTGADRAERLEGLRALAEGRPHPALVRGRAGSAKTAFVFPGQGSQWQGMATELLASSPVFERSLRECAEALSPHLDWPLMDAIEATPEAPSLERIEVVQPVLFAVAVALAELWRSYGVRPSAVVGHSQGEIAAACVAGALSLEDAARLTALRSQVIAKLVGQGAMVSIGLPAEEVMTRLQGWGEGVELAAINSPSSVAVACGQEQIAGLLAECERDGIRAREVAATIPSHSRHVEVLREEVLELLAPIQPRSGEIPFYSTVTGEQVDGAELDAGYWYRNLREPVRFEQVTRALIAAGAGAFVEISAHPVLTMALGETAEACAPDPASIATIGSLRRGEGGLGRFAASLAAAHTHGVAVDWPAFFAPHSPAWVDLPTYAFQRSRYWLRSGDGAGDAGWLGQAAADHPFLGAVLSLANEEQTVLSGRIALGTHPWLADHVVLGAAILPGTGFLELALRAGEEVGAEEVEELTLEAPLVIPERGAVQIQVRVGPADPAGRRELEIHSRPEDRDGPDREWSKNAVGILCRQAEGVPEPADRGEWPPAGAEPIEVDLLYREIAAIGVDYGPAFQGVQAAWRRGEELFAEAELPREQLAEAGLFAIHPALLDAALHSALLDGEPAAEGETAVPFSWSGVRLHRTGATRLRARMSPKLNRAGLTVSDETGAAVVSIASVATRPIDTAQLGAAAGAARQDSLFGLDWKELAPPAGPEPLFEPFECGRDEGLDPAAAAQALCAEVLEELQGAIADERRVAFLTHGARVLSEGEPSDPAAAAAAGLVRSAQAEHPGRFLLIDSDGAEASRQALAAALAVEGEPQLAIREGVLLAPRLAPVAAQPAEEAPPPLDPNSTVLITGGTGGIGALLARHLVVEHGARHLLLASRRGAEAEGAAELRDELSELGAEVEIAACDVSDREALAGLLASIPAEHPLGGVIHCATAFDNGLIESLDPERMRTVLAVKAAGAWHLHELTEAMELSTFVVFSSVAGTFNNAGQGNYAAANAFLDGLVQHRRRQGLAGNSIAWGLWERGKAGGDERLGELDQARLSRDGFVAMAAAQGLELFDRARALDAPFVVAAELDSAALRSLARSGTLSPLLSGLVRVSNRRPSGPSGSLSRRLAEVAEPEREALVLELVRAQAAAVLGHASGEALAPERAFKDAGFDSLGAVELRNSLSLVTGLTLSTTLVFDYPNPRALAGYLRSQAEGAGLGAAVRVRAPVRTEEPIAIVGMSCRYAGGVASPEDLWRLVATGSDAISGFPEDRGWDLDRLYDPDPESVGTVYTRSGGFLDDIAGFDAGFFGISPREALLMDPQQRLLLEAAWEAFEDAGVDPDSLGGTDTGVFAGVMPHDYGLGLSGLAEAGGFPPSATGSVVSGRVAYTFGLEGPAISVDTACSSSLVAMHMAGQALRGGECSLALAGGVTAVVTPGMLLDFSQKRALSADGRCKAFAAAADGTGLSEGVGLLVLERLSDARRNGHRVLATMLGSAINQDGASNGFAAPNGPAQERMVQQALAAAGLAAADVDAVEAHGTGTTLGDPIEAQALLATYGQGREQGRPLRLGSIKSNIGHAQAAAGVAGVIKTVMAMRHEVLPQTLHIDEPTPHVDWEAGEIELLVEPLAWERNDRPRRAGVSAFGMTGTNAHVILEEAPADEPVVEPERDDPPLDAVPFLLSAKSEEALSAQAGRLRSHLEASPDLDPTDIAFSLATARAALPHRAAAIGADREELLRGLGALAEGEPHPGVVQGKATPGKTAFMFTGQGAQRPGMGRGLHEGFPAYAEALDKACAELDPHLDLSLKEHLFAAEGTPEAELLNRTELTQPALFATEVALFRLVESWGLRPDFLIGHSIGELAAAHVSGVLSLPDACKLVAARGRLMGALPEGGAMVAIEASEEEVAGTLPGGLSIAGVNDPGSVVVSGGEEAALALLQAWKDKGRKATRLKVSHAFHSELMEPMLEEFASVAAELSFNDPQIPIVSNLTGDLLTAEQAASPEYWARQVREAVRFMDGVACLHEQGVTSYLELGPDGVLCAMAQGCLDADAEATLAPLLRKGRPDSEALVGALAAAHSSGVSIDWADFFAPYAPSRVDLPTYAFQRSRYWVEPLAGAGDAASIGQASADHPLLGAVTSLAGEEQTLLSGRISLKTHAWLADHVIHGSAILPGTAFVELALRAGEEAGAETIEELALEAPLALPEQGAVQLQVKVGPSDDTGRRAITIHSRLEVEVDAEAEEWSLNASGSLGLERACPAADLGQWPPPGAEPIEVEEIYDRMVELGVDYGPAFEGVKAAWRQGSELFAEAQLPERQSSEAGGYGIHPALLDAALHVASLELGGDEDGGPRVPFGWRGVSLHRAGASSLRVRLDTGVEESGFVLADETGAPVIAVDSVATRAIDPAQLGAHTSTASNSLFTIEWQEVPAPTVAEHEVEVFECVPDPALDLVAAAQALCAEVLEALQGAIAGEKRLAFLTRGAQALGEGESVDPAAASVWGLVRSAQAEHPGRFSLIDSDRVEASTAALAAALAVEDEPQLAIREGALSAPRLTPLTVEPEEAAPFGPEATVLVTGGTGGLGALLARHLAAERGVRHLLLVGRRGPKADGAAELREELTELGAEVEIAACDVSDRKALAELLGSIPEQHPLGAVIHAAGVVDDGTIERLDRERLGRTMSAKAGGAWHLHELTAGADLSHFVLFSSAAASFNNPGQGNYAAANAFLDGLAHYRRAEGLPAVALGWGAWNRATGMSEGIDAGDLARLGRTGIAVLSEEQGLAHFDRAPGFDRAQLLPVALNRGGLRAAARAGALSPLFSGLVRVPAGKGADGGEPLAQRLSTMPEAEWDAAILALVRGHVATVLGHASAMAIDPQAPFKDLGFDSLGAVELRNRLSGATAMQLPTTLVFDYPTTAAVAEFIRGEVGGGGGSDGASVDRQIDKLESMLEALAADQREQADGRLRSLLTRRDMGGDGAAAVDRIQSATAEEILEIVNEEIGAR